MDVYQMPKTTLARTAHITISLLLLLSRQFQCCH